MKINLIEIVDALAYLGTVYAGWKLATWPLFNLPFPEGLLGYAAIVGYIFLILIFIVYLKKWVAKSEFIGNMIEFLQSIRSSKK